jgi:hypothetical protein
MVSQVIWMYEDELPEMTDEVFALAMTSSTIVDGVRMYPIVIFLL